MKFKNYLVDKFLSIIIFIFSYFICLMLFVAFKSPLSLILAITFTYFSFGVCILLLNYFKKRNFYNKLLNSIEKLDKKYLVCELVEKPNFYEGKLLYNALYEINKSMIERINEYKDSIIDFKDYVEMWIHEVKLPLSTLFLMVHNNNDKFDKRVVEQLNRLDNYLEQVLYYVRSENADVDYLIKENSLNILINEVALRNKNNLLEENILLTVSNVNIKVLTDAKWFVFILNQIINNSIKYKDIKKNSFIKIEALENEESVFLMISDNGIGIAKSDLPKVFEKSFTGLNGRRKNNSTGMGLYIVRQMCIKLGHKIEIDSVEGEYTKVIVTFSKNNYYDVVK